jgi:ketosteroid isomerase-like protein
MQTLMSYSVLRPLLALALLFTTAAGFGAEPAIATHKNDVSDVLAADRAWAKAAIGDNADLFASYMLDEYVLLEWEMATAKTPSHWASTSKKDWVAAVRGGTQRYSAVELHNQIVHLQGSIATVTGEYSQTAIKDGKDDSASGSYVETWVKRNGRWLVLNSVFP